MRFCDFLKSFYLYAFNRDVDLDLVGSVDLDLVGSADLDLYSECRSRSRGKKKDNQELN